MARRGRLPGDGVSTPAHRRWLLGGQNVDAPPRAAIWQPLTKMASLSGKHGGCNGSTPFLSAPAPGEAVFASRLNQMEVGRSAAYGRSSFSRSKPLNAPKNTEHGFSGLALYIGLCVVLCSAFMSTLLTYIRWLCMYIDVLISRKSHFNNHFKESVLIPG